MNMMFNPVEFIHRLEGEGLSRGAAETNSEAIEERNRALATKADLAELVTKGDLLATQSDVDAKITLVQTVLQHEITKALNRQTLAFGAMLFGVTGLALTVAGLKFAR